MTRLRNVDNASGPRPADRDLRRAVAVALLPLWFWPLVWGSVALVLIPFAQLTAEPHQREGSVSGFIFLGLFTGMISAAPALTASVAMAILTYRSGTFGYRVGALAGACATLAWTLAIDGIGKNGVAARELVGWPCAGAAFALVGRFAMSRLGILPSRWPAGWPGAAKS
jgi:hypothetical protein